MNGYSNLWAALVVLSGCAVQPVSEPASDTSSMRPSDYSVCDWRDFELDAELAEAAETDPTLSAKQRTRGAYAYLDVVLDNYREMAVLTVGKTSAQAAKALAKEYNDAFLVDDDHPGHWTIENQKIPNQLRWSQMYSLWLERVHKNSTPQQVSEALFQLFGSITPYYTWAVLFDTYDTSVCIAQALQVVRNGYEKIHDISTTQGSFLHRLGIEHRRYHLKDNASGYIDDDLHTVTNLDEFASPDMVDELVAYLFRDRNLEIPQDSASLHEYISTNGRGRFYDAHRTWSHIAFWLVQQPMSEWSEFLEMIRTPQDDQPVEPQYHGSWMKTPNDKFYQTPLDLIAALTSHWSYELIVPEDKLHERAVGYYGYLRRLRQHLYPDRNLDAEVLFGPTDLEGPDGWSRLVALYVRLQKLNKLATEIRFRNSN